MKLLCVYEDSIRDFETLLYYKKIKASPDLMEKAMYHMDFMSLYYLLLNKSIKYSDKLVDHIRDEFKRKLHKEFLELNGRIKFDDGTEDIKCHNAIIIKDIEKLRTTNKAKMDEFNQTMKALKQG